MTKHIDIPIIGEIAIPLLSDNKKDKKDKKNKKDKNNKNGQPTTEINEISSNEILVRVYKDFGSNTEILKAEYPAYEMRDNFNNLISINEQFSHNQDTDFLIDDVYREMNIILELGNKTTAEKIELLDKKIKKQDRLLRDLEKFPKLNAMFNYCDEDLKSRDYKIFLNHIKKGINDGVGAYFTIEHGKRVYSFMACEGYLVPIWHGIDNYTQYPDHTRKLKITVQEDMLMKQELEEFNKNKKVVNIVVWIAVITLILFGLNIWAGTWLWGENVKIHDKFYSSAEECAKLTQEMNAAYGGLIQNVLISPNTPKVINSSIVKLSPQEVK
jgi:hypothetical protein